MLNDEEIEKCLKLRKKIHVLCEENKEINKETMQNFTTKKNQLIREELPCYNTGTNHISVKINNILIENAVDCYGKVENNDLNLQCPCCGSKYVARYHYTEFGFVINNKDKVLNRDTSNEEQKEKMPLTINKWTLACVVDDEDKSNVCLSCGNEFDN